MNSKIKLSFPAFSFYIIIAIIFILYTVACPSGITLCKDSTLAIEPPPPWGFQSINQSLLRPRIRKLVTVAVNWTSRKKLCDIIMN